MNETDCLEVRSVGMRGLLSYILERTIPKKTGVEMTEIEVKKLNVHQGNGEITFDLHITGTLPEEELRKLIHRLL